MATPTDNFPQSEHVARYQATDGREGGIWRGGNALLITTRGRKSGEPRTTPLVYGRDGDRYLLVATNSGAPKHPNWYLNLSAHPEVGVQVLTDKFKAQARTANAEERPRLWKLMTDMRPIYLEYQTRTSREIPVVILERI